MGFALSSKDRAAYTRQTLAALDSEGGFDIIWNDGSEHPEARALPKTFAFRQARLVEVNYDVGGGPDRSICFGLERLLALGYDYVGLMENDIVPARGWFRRLMSLFALAAADGIVCGAATVRSYASRVMEHRAGYSLNWGTGAGMVLFARPAAEIILREYSRLRMSSAGMKRFYAQLFGVDLKLMTRDRAGQVVEGVDVWLTCDWGYTPMLYLHGYASVGSIPSLARDLDLPPGDFLRHDYVGPDRYNTGLVVGRTAPSIPVAPAAQLV